MILIGNETESTIRYGGENSRMKSLVCLGEACKGIRWLKSRITILILLLIKSASDGVDTTFTESLNYQINDLAVVLKIATLEGNLNVFKSDVTHFEQHKVVVTIKLVKTYTNYEDLAEISDRKRWSKVKIGGVKFTMLHCLLYDERWSNWVFKQRQLIYLAKVVSFNLKWNGKQSTADGADTVPQQISVRLHLLKYAPRDAPIVVKPNNTC